MMGSPLNYFDAQTGGRQNMFNIGAAIGGVNSPAAGPTEAIRSVLERARKWTDTQQEYALKGSLLRAGKGVFPATQPKMHVIQDPTTKQYFYTTESVDPETGGSKYSNYSHVTPDDALTTMINNSIEQGIGAGGEGGAPVLSDAEKRLEELLNQL